MLSLKGNFFGALSFNLLAQLNEGFLVKNQGGVMLITNKEYLANYAEKAQELEKQIHRTTTTSKLNQLAQEAATYHRILSAHLMSKDQTNKDVLTELLQKFSQIETEVLLKFYRPSKSMARSSVL